MMRCGMAIVGTMALLGCNNTPSTPAPIYPASTTLGYMTASPAVAILAVGGTQQLSVTGVSLTGVPIATFDSVRYLLPNKGDTLRVKLTGAGLVTALAPSSAAIPVNVFAFQQDIAKGYQILLQVTATVVPGVTLSIQPVAPDSAKQAMGTAKTITPVLRNPTTGASVSSPVMRYTVNPADANRVGVYIPTLTLANGIAVQQQRSSSAGMNQILPQTPTGTAWIYATANVYGTLLQDSVQYTFSYPYAMTISTGETQLDITSAFNSQILTLAPGATITFRNNGSDNGLLTVAYTFDNPAAVTAAIPAATIGGATGNVTTLTQGKTSNRMFLTPGTYHWTATAVGWPTVTSSKTLSGTIVIK